MIQKVTALTNVQKNYPVSTLKKTNMSVPELLNNNSSYTVNNLQANYMPIAKNKVVSFGSDMKQKAVALKITHVGDSYFLDSTEPNPEVKNITTLKPQDIVNGDYYGELCEDMSVLLNTDKNIVLKSQKNVDLNIVAQSFAKKVAEGKYQNTGLLPNYTEVYLIEDPVEAEQQSVMFDVTDEMNERLEQIKELSDNEKTQKELSQSIVNKRFNISKYNLTKKTISEIISELSKDNTTQKVLFLNDFELFALGAKKQGISSLNKFLDEMAPNVSIVGIVDKKSYEDEAKLYKAQTGSDLNTNEYEGLIALNLSGLNTKETQEYLEKNPQVTAPLLNRYTNADLKFTEEAQKELIAKTSVKIDGALPKTVLKMMDRIITDKTNKLSEETLYSDEEILITEKDIKDFFKNHSKIIAASAVNNSSIRVAEDTKLTLKDVGGMSNEKQMIEEDLLPYLKDPQGFIAKGGIAPGGILLSGSPGNGKTLLAKALSGETSTPFISMAGSEFVNKYVGVGAAKVREMAELARNAAANSPNKAAIIFIDEIDTIGRKRGSGDGGGEQEAESTLNQLLQEMDGFNSKDSDVRLIFMAATNRKDILDEALVRPGRFDYDLEVSNPKTNQDRYEILKVHAKDMQFESEEAKEKVLKDAAEFIFAGCSGAEIAGALRKAQMISTKRDDNKFVTYDDIMEGQLTTEFGPIKKTVSDRPKEDIIETIEHEFGHAVAIDFLNPILGNKISLITLDERGNFLGMVQSKSSEMSPNFKSIILSAAVNYMGGMSEPNFNKQGRSAGVSQDLSQLTNLFQRAITEWGMGIYTPPITMVPNSHTNNPTANAYYETVRKANEKNIAKDTALFTALATSIALMIKKLHDGASKPYVQKYLDNAGKGGNNFTGESFHAFRADWIKANGKEKQAEKVLKQIEMMLENTISRKNKMLKRTSRRLAFGL